MTAFMFLNKNMNAARMFNPPFPRLRRTRKVEFEEGKNFK